MGFFLVDLWLKLLKTTVTSSDRDLRYGLLVLFFIQVELLLIWKDRRSNASNIPQAMLWILFQFLESLPSYIIGLIVATRDQAPADQDSDILALWAPFLLLLCGGLDFMTALSPDDNQLWSRRAIQLAAMIYAIVNTYLGSFEEGKFLLPVILVFIAGFSKYFERVFCNYWANFTRMKDSLAQKKKGSPSKSLELEVYVDDGVLDSNLGHLRLTRDSYRLFESFKGMYVNLQIPDEVREKSREHFLNRDDKEYCTSIVEKELNFAYQEFYSKSVVTKHWLGQCLRLLSIICLVSTLVLWSCMDKHNYSKFDGGVTYALIVSAVFVDLVSLLGITRSDLTMATILEKSNLSLASERRDQYSILKKASLFIVGTKKKHDISSDPIPQLNLLESCRALDRGKTFVFSQHLSPGNFLHQVIYAKEKYCYKEAIDWIYPKLIHRSRQGFKRTDAAESVDQYAVANYMPHVEEEVLSKLLSLSTTVRTYDETLLLWNIATTLCYYTEHENSTSQSCSGESEESECTEDPPEERDGLTDDPAERINTDGSEIDDVYCIRIISDYMLHTLMYNSKMMLQVAAMGEMRYRETLSETKKFFVESSYRHEYMYTDSLKIVQDNEELKDEGNSVWYAACRLAIELNMLDEKEEIELWKVIGDVWVEMVLYAAAHCSAREHVARLPKGGDFLTFIWILMEHLGLGKGTWRVEGPNFSSSTLICVLQTRSLFFFSFLFYVNLLP